MNESKCIKCGFANETFQRGPKISGTRCLSCGYETFSKLCNTVGELRLFLEKMTDDTRIVFQDDAVCVRLEAHFKEEMSRTEQVKFWQGSDK